MATTVCASTVAVSAEHGPKLSTATVVPNKHIPYCSPGPLPSARRHDNAASFPPSSASSIISLSPSSQGPTCLTYPPDDFQKICSRPSVYGITAEQLVKILDHLASQPLPLPQQVFPWLHGLHADNQLQLAFFAARRKALRKTPKSLRGLTVVKARGDLSHSKIKGAVAPEEILAPAAVGRDGEELAEFLEADPREGFSVRNFQIQTCKFATIGDIVVYGDDVTPRGEVEQLARRIAYAQASWQKKIEGTSGTPLYNTFILTDEYTVVETDCPDLIAIDSQSCLTGKVMDFGHWERIEMTTMSAPRQISHNVWLGPTPDVYAEPDPNVMSSFDLFVETSDAAQLPDNRVFQLMEHFMQCRDKPGMADHVYPQLEFPGSGSILPPTWSQSEVDCLLDTCQWLYKQAHGFAGTAAHKRRDSKLSLGVTVDADGDSDMVGNSTTSSLGRQILIHCADGYTESSLLGVAYYMYAECKPVHEAWIALHTQHKRDFFAYASDVALLRAIQPRILQSSPKYSGNIQELCPSVPSWLEKMDGSLPSRILDYMYLGNLNHANNPALLKELGIGQILSVGEPVSWSPEVTESWGADNLLMVDQVQDNGVDPLTNEFSRCLAFIEHGRKKGTATLVHCRVGVSRSATICIAEVMNELGLSYPRAYCFVRARRLNVIIQPHLRFSYELLKWEEFQCQKRGKPLRRELEWASIARGIAEMNRPYSRQG